MFQHILKLIFCLSLVSNLFAQHGLSGTDDWWNSPNYTYYDNEEVRKGMSYISVKGKNFIEDDGNIIVFKGLNISDPTKLEKDGKFTKAHFEVIKSWGANLIRVPVHPIAWKQKGDKEYFKLLDQIIVWANELKIYLVFEWHGIGNLKAGLFHNPMHETTLQETTNFWRKIAQRYKGIPVLAFYEIFNEPTTSKGKYGKLSWADWKKINEDIIEVIFSWDKKIIPLVAGFNYAYDLRDVKENPINIEGIGYVAHPYPQKAPAPWLDKWEEYWGFVADKYPLVATELGYMAADDPGAHRPCISDKSYAIALANYFNKKGISFTAWCFDPHWPPQLISDYDYTPTEYGAFFKEVMLGNFKYSE